MSILPAVAASRRFSVGGTPPPSPSVATTLTVGGSTSVTEGASTQLTAVVRDQYGAVMTGQPVTWSSDSANATVDSSGLVSGQTAGGATITATSGAASGTFAITVTSATPGGVVVDDTLPALTGLTAMGVHNDIVHFRWDLPPTTTDRQYNGVEAFYTTDGSTPDYSSPHVAITGIMRGIASELFDTGAILNLGWSHADVRVRVAMRRLSDLAMGPLSDTTLSFAIGADPGTVAPLATVDFSDGLIAHSNALGFDLPANEWVTIDSTTAPPGATSSARILRPGKAASVGAGQGGGGDNEWPFVLGANYPDVWFEYWFKFPTDYFYRNPAPKSYLSLSWPNVTTTASSAVVTAPTGTFAGVNLKHIPIAINGADGAGGVFEAWVLSQDSDEQLTLDLPVPVTGTFTIEHANAYGSYFGSSATNGMTSYQSKYFNLYNIYDPSKIPSDSVSKQRCFFLQELWSDDTQIGKGKLRPLVSHYGGYSSEDGHKILEVGGAGATSFPSGEWHRYRIRVSRGAALDSGVLREMIDDTLVLEWVNVPFWPKKSDGTMDERSVPAFFRGKFNGAGSWEPSADNYWWQGPITVYVKDPYWGI